MRTRMRRLAQCFALGFVSLASTLISARSVGPSPAPTGTPEQIEHFERNVRPLLSQSCGKCHGPMKQGGGLRLDSREAIL